MLKYKEFIELAKQDISLAITTIYKQIFEQLVIVDTTTTAKSNVANLLLKDFDRREKTKSQIETTTTTTTYSDDDIWIFGYGSLVWKADFPYIDRRRGFIRGYKRRFYQHSIDHRGTPEKPGRVVTLLQGDQLTDRVYGVAYRIASSQKHDVLNHLDYREKNGYERCTLKFYEFDQTATQCESTSQTAPSSDVVMYIATQSNNSYAGAIWQLPRIAEQIFSSAGPSGPNREYLFNLDIAMSTLFPGAIDEHLQQLVACVRELIVHDEPVLLERALHKEIRNILTSFLDAATKEEANEDARVHWLSERLNDLRARCIHDAGWREVFIAKELTLMPQINGTSDYYIHKYCE